MNIVEELEKLAKLRDQGILTEEEFITAKKKILAQDIDRSESVTERRIRPSLIDQNNALGKFPFPTDSNDQSVGRAANRYVTLQGISFVVTLIVLLILSLSFCSSSKESDKIRNQRQKHQTKSTSDWKKQMQMERELNEQLTRKYLEQEDSSPPSSTPE